MRDINFEENTIVLANNSQYKSIIVDVPSVLKSWRLSLMSFEWLDFHGNIKAPEEMPETERLKRAEIEQKFKENKSILKPILGIGIQDNVEIGSGRAEFLTLAAAGLKTMPVHVRVSQIKDFKPFLADVDS